LFCIGSGLALIDRRRPCAVVDESSVWRAAATAKGISTKKKHNQGDQDSQSATARGDWAADASASGVVHL
jgi:hypothetical protein